jgi:ubiquinone/menaquinone biosynthesis C-methylase UbiE
MNTAENSDKPPPPKVFLRPTFHHSVEQEKAIAELSRVLKKPAGLLLFVESMYAYIHSSLSQLLFRHPIGVQRSADEYPALIRDAGFSVEPQRVSFPVVESQ